MATIKIGQMQSGYHTVSLNVKSLFTNISLEYLIELALERVYNK